MPSVCFTINVSISHVQIRCKILVRFLFIDILFIPVDCFMHNLRARVSLPQFECRACGEAIYLQIRLTNHFGNWQVYHTTPDDCFETKKDTLIDLDFLLQQLEYSQALSLLVQIWYFSRLNPENGQILFGTLFTSSSFNLSFDLNYGLKANHLLLQMMRILLNYNMHTFSKIYNE